MTDGGAPGACLFVSWAPYCSRSDNIARELGGVSYMVYYPVFGSHYVTAPLKYFCQAVETLLRLVRHRPRLILCMSPPVFVCLPVWLYTSLVRRAGFVIDYHTAAFVTPIHQTLFPIQRFFARRAITNIVTNEELAGVVEAWGGDTTIIGDVRVEFPAVEPCSLLRDGFNVVFVASYARSEPHDIVFEAATRLADQGVTFYVTGALRDAPRPLVERAPDNVVLTDFLRDAEYAGLLRDADVALCLCLDDHTMQRGAYEAVAQETPLIISDWPLLRRTFSRGAIYVQNTADDVTRAVTAMMSELPQHRAGVRELRQMRSRAFDEAKTRLEHKVARHLDVRARRRVGQ